MIPANIRIDGSSMSQFAIVPPPPLSAARPVDKFGRSATVAEDCVIDLNRHERGKRARIAYESTVSTLLEEIDTSLVGRILLLAIKNSGKTLVIKPHVQIEPNAIVSPKSEADARNRGVDILWNLKDSPKTKINESLQPKIPNAGTGLGSDCEMTLSPPIPSFPELPFSVPIEYSVDPHAVLVHELVHCVRFMTGTAQFYPLHDPAAHYKNTEEFVAVLIANIYASECGETALRRDYTSPGYAPMEPRFAERGKFFDISTAYGRANLTALSRTRLDRVLIRRIASAQARYNPLRDLLEIPGRVSAQANAVWATTLRLLGV